MSEIRVGAEAEPEVVHATVVVNRVQNPKDPYDTPSERAECDDWIFNKLFFWTGVGGTFSTWRERHIFLRGFYNGFNTQLQQKFDPCPEMWEDEAQYYEAGQEAGYIVKNGAIWIPTSGAVGATLTYVLTNINTIIPLILKLTGQ